MTVHVPTVSPTGQLQAKASTSDGPSMLDAVKGAFGFRIGGGGDRRSSHLWCDWLLARSVALSQAAR